MPMDDFYPGPGQYSEEGEEMETEETEVRTSTSVHGLILSQCVDSNHITVHSTKHFNALLSRPGLAQWRTWGTC